MPPATPHITGIDLMEDKKIARIKELVPILNRASAEYYSKGSEIMTDRRYDELYDELSALEAQTGVILSSSPTQRVGYEVQSSLPKQRHESPMLSLSKTKNRDELSGWLAGREGLLSWKLDGLTIVLTYEDGSLTKAVTRGNGQIGEVITANARGFENLPGRIPFTGSLVVRGEAVISYRDFDSINRELDEDSKYKNPRNLCAGSVRALDPAITAARHVNLIAFSLVSASKDGEQVDFENSMEKRFAFLKEQGFDVVEYRRVDPGNVVSVLEEFEKKIYDNPYPSDGLVLLLDDISYGESLGRTAKAPRNAIAFKWADETAQTELLDIEWSCSRTGLINPVAVFRAVELEGTQVSRASVHNISIVKELALGRGDIITVYKANMIIPQIAENLTRSGTAVIPDRCPACLMPTRVRAQYSAETLVCENPDCPAKRIKSFTQFCSRDAMNIEGLSEQTLEKLVSRGFIREWADIYRVGDHAEDIEEMEGFGELSCANLLASIEKSRDTQLSRFLYAIGIPGIGVALSKVLARHFDGDFERVASADIEELSSIDGVGDIMAADIRAFFDDEKKLHAVRRALDHLRLEKENTVDDSSPISGLTFVVTGSVNSFSGRSELKRYIEDRGGKVTGSVTSKTDYLINNDVNSTSSKNKKAAELGVKVISEETFLEMFAGGAV